MGSQVENAVARDTWSKYPTIHPLGCVTKKLHIPKKKILVVNFSDKYASISSFFQRLLYISVCFQAFAFVGRSRSRASLLFLNKSFYIFTCVVFASAVTQESLILIE
jgi:hypothetical protein